MKKNQDKRDQDISVIELVDEKIKDILTVQVFSLYTLTVYKPY